VTLPVVLVASVATVLPVLFNVNVPLPSSSSCDTVMGAAWAWVTPPPEKSPVLSTMPAVT